MPAWKAPLISVKSSLIFGTRDDRPETPVLTARMERAQKNMMEALPIFLPLALLLEMKGITGGLATAGAATFTIARLLYPAGYASPWPLLRSAIWTAGHIGLGIMVWALLT